MSEVDYITKGDARFARVNGVEVRAFNYEGIICSHGVVLLDTFFEDYDSDISHAHYYRARNDLVEEGVLEQREDGLGVASEYDVIAHDLMEKHLEGFFEQGRDYSNNEEGFQPDREVLNFIYGQLEGEDTPEFKVRDVAAGEYNSSRIGHNMMRMNKTTDENLKARETSSSTIWDTQKTLEVIEEEFLEE